MADGVGGERVFVTKLPQAANKEDVNAYFSQYGTTTDVFVPFVPGSQGHKGIAFVSFAEGGTAENVIHSGPHELRGAQIVVDMATSKGEGKGGHAGHAVRGHHGGAASQGASGERLFVTKVPQEVQKDDLVHYFSAFGDLSDVYLPSAPGSATHKGICFISFVDASAASAALQTPSHDISGHQVVVDAAAPKGASKGSKGKGGCAPSPVAHQQPASFLVGARKGGKGSGGGGRGGAGGFVPRPVAVDGLGLTVAPAAAEGATFRARGNGVAIPGRLFLTHVTADITKSDLEFYFQQFGGLSDVFVPNGNKGIAFVTFAEPSEAEAALAYGDHNVKEGTTRVVADQAYDQPADGGKGKGGKGALGGKGAIRAPRSRPY